MRTSDELLAPSGEVRNASEELIIKEARRRHRRRVLATVGIVVLVTAGILITALSLQSHGPLPSHSLTAPSVRPDPLSAKTSVCHSGQVRVSSLGGGAGAGNVDQVFAFVNASSASCTLRGYPRIVALDAEGKQVAVAEQQLSGLGGAKTGATTPPVVTLRPGQTASAMVSGTDIPTDNAVACPAGYPAFLITPPGATQPTRVAAADGPGPGYFPGCSTLIRVNPIVAGVTGQAASASPS